MISDILFNNIKFLSRPASKKLVIFSCDEIYFQKYGYYNLVSCLNINQAVHIHIINPTDLTNLEILKNKNISMSYEYIDNNLLNFYQLKTYYYCSRFLIANFLFEKYKIDNCIVTDADVFFNEKVYFDSSIILGLMHNPEETAPWKKVSAPVCYFTQKSKTFLESVIKTYIDKLNSTDFDILEKISDKVERGNILGLDQVCLSINLTNEVLANNFVNLKSINKLISKDEFDGKIWIMTNRNLKSDVNSKLRLDKKIGYNI